MTQLVASSVGVVRNRRTILDSVSAQFGGGELVALIGPNGAGKSTFLSVLAGLTQANTGYVTLDQMRLEQLSRTRLARQRAYIPQNPRCEWPISVERLVSLGLSPDMSTFGTLTSEQARRVQETLRECDLDNCRHQPATTLSGGELHRAMLARALVADPPVLIFDEPTTGLDPRHTLDAMNRFSRLAREGHLVLIAMHDLSLVGRFATRLIALKGGRLFADGATDEQLNESLLREVFDVNAKLTKRAKEVFVSFEIDS